MEAAAAGTSEQRSGSGSNSNSGEEFVTVVNVQPTTSPSSVNTASAESFVTVLSIGEAGKQQQQLLNGAADPAHPEEEVEVYRLPGERLGFGLKFEGGNKTSERVRRLFIQSCAEQSPASRATCSWGHLGEGDEVLSIDEVPVTEMTRLDCVRRLKESQLVIKLLVRCRGALRPEVVSAERKLGQQQHQQRSKIPPELPAAPPPVPPRKSRHGASANRSPADGEASPGTKKSWDSPKSTGSSQNGSPQSQGSYRSAASSTSTRSSTYESCASSPAKSSSGSKNDSPKDSPKAHVSPVLSKTKQEPPAEAQWYLDARSHDGSSTHGSTSDDTSSSLSTVVDRFSSSDRFSTTSTASTTSEQLYHPEHPATHPLATTDCLVNGGEPVSTAIVPLLGGPGAPGADLGSPDFLLTRLANSEARTHVESRGDVERVTAVVAPNTVLIEETPALQPPLCFQDAPLSYGHEPRPGIFYAADLAADSRTHFRPIKDDAEMVEKVVNGDKEDVLPARNGAPPLPARNHVNRISINQQQQQLQQEPSATAVTVAKEVEPEPRMPQLPPKPMPRKDVKSKRKRPPPPPPPPRREPPPPVPEARNIEPKKDENVVEVEATPAAECSNRDVPDEAREAPPIEPKLEEKPNEIEAPVAVVKPVGLVAAARPSREDTESELDELDGTMATKTNKVLEIVEMKKAKALTPRKAPSRTSDLCEVPERGADASADGEEDGSRAERSRKSKKILIEMRGVDTISIEMEDSSDEEEEKEAADGKVAPVHEETVDSEAKEEEEERVDEEREGGKLEEDEVVRIEAEENSRFLEAIRDGGKDMPDEDEMTDESDGDDYYWQSNLATIGEEEENNSLEYENANEIPIPPVTKPVENPQIIEDIIETSSEAVDTNARDELDCVRRIASDSRTVDKKQDKSSVNGRMDNCGGGGQRLPPDGDEFPAAYQEFTSPSQQYQYVTTRETMASNGEVDRGESVVDGTGFIPAEKTVLITKTLNVAESRSLLDKKDGTSEFKQSTSSLLEIESEKRTSVSNYVLYSTQKTATSNHLAEKKIEIADYYSKEVNSKSSIDEPDLDGSPPPLPLTGPPKIDNRTTSQERKFSASNGDLWRQDNKSEKSVKDKIAMFSSQSSLEAPLFPTSIAATAVSCATSTVNSSPRRLSKHKSSDDVFADDKRSTMAERTQSSFDLSANNLHHKKVPSLPQTSPPSSPGSVNGYSTTSSPSYLQKSPEIGNKHSVVNSNSSSKSSSPLGSYATAYNSGASSPSKSFDTTASPPTKSPPALIRATSFSGSPSPYGLDKLQTSSEVLSSPPTIARTTSLASTFKRPNDEMRKSSLNQLIEQRRKGISKLRGLVIPEKDAVPVDQPITDLPEIKSRESILINQVPRSNIHDKWGSQSSLASNASTVSSSIRTNTSFKMPAPKILSNYSPAFKRKSFSVYNNTQSNNSAILNGSKNGNTNNQLSSPASDAPKSLESICSPTRSDYSFDFVSSSGSPDNNLPVSKPKLNCQRKIGRNEYDDSDNDSAVSSSQSSISRGFSPPMSPVPSDRSTISSERSYLSSENHYQRPQLILDKTNGTTVVSDRIYNARSNLMSERSYSVPEKSSYLKSVNQQQPNETLRSSQIPQRQMLKRSSSTETNSSNSSTLTSGSQASAESLSRRVLKPQSVEAINRKNILASARCRSGRDLNGSPLIQRKFSDEEENGDASTDQQETVGFVNAHRVTNGNAESTKPEIKIAYIEITENVIVEEEKFSSQKKLEEQPQQQPRLPPKRSIIPQAKNVPIPTSRPPKPEILEPSNDIRSWVKSEMRNLTSSNSIDRSNSYDSRKKTSSCDTEIPSPSNRNFRSKSSLALNEQSPSMTMGSRSQSIDGEGDIDLSEAVKPKSRSNLTLKKSTDSDLLTVLTTKSRSRSAIHMEDGSYGKLKSQMSLEDILVSKSTESSPSKLPRSQSINSESRGSIDKIADPSLYSGMSESLRIERSVRRSISTESWSEEKLFTSKIPSLNSRTGKLLLAENIEETSDTCDLSKSPSSCTKIPMARNLGRRSASVTDMKKVFEKMDHSSSNGTTSSGVQSGNAMSHNRFPSLDSSVEENIRPVGRENSSNSSSSNGCCEPDQERFSGEQFGSISSLASSTSLISQQELAQLVEEANLEEPRGGYDVAVVLLHKENPAGSVGIILAGGSDCETKEITIHRVLTHSIADKEGSVQRGDRILSINGRSMRGLTHRESLAVLKQPRSELVLVVSRAKAEDMGATPTTTAPAPRLRSRLDSVDSSIADGYKTNGVLDNTAWGPPLVVAMYKDGTGLGFSLEGGHDSPLGDRPLLIKKIFTGGAAEKTGALRAGDQLLEVNNRDVSKMSRIEAWSLMKKLPDGEVSLLVRHPATKSS